MKRQPRRKKHRAREPANVLDALRAGVRASVHDFFEPSLLLLQTAGKALRLAWRWLVRR